MKHTIIATVIALFAILAFAYFGGAKAFGAHPFWTFKVALIGAPVGILVAMAASYLSLSKPKRIGFFAILVLIAFAGAYFGKVEFAASYAENQLAGKFWFLGWIATCAAATATIFSAIK